MKRRGEPSDHPLELVDPRFTCPFDLPVQALVTDVDLRERLLYALEHEQEVDGAEGVPLTFNLADLEEGLNACSPSTSQPTFPAVPSLSPPHSFTRTRGALPSPLSSPHPPSSSLPTWPLIFIAPVPLAHPPHPVNLPHSVPSPSSVPLTVSPLCSHSNLLCTCGPETSGVEKKGITSSRGRAKKQSKLRSIKKRRAHAAVYEDGRVPNFFRTPRLSTFKHVPPPQTITTDLDSTALPVARHCWVGRNLVPQRSTPWTYQELLDKGFKVVPWKGGQPQAVTDKDGRAVVLLVGGPTEDADWGQVVKEVAQTFASVRNDGLAAGAFPSDAQNHRRGTFVALPVGVSHGNGRLKPGNLFHPPERKKLIQRLLDDKSIRRLACYQSSVFAFYAPKLYAQYCHSLLRVFEHDHSLQRNFEGSIFPATSFNLGPSTVSIDHTDASNVGYGLCALASIGSFDSRKGGHLILFDMGLMLEFPPGSVALLPSGILRHGNTTIQAGEERYSIAQYCAGGLLRWTKYGHQTAASIRKNNPKAKAKDILATLDGNHADRVDEALGLFSKIDELDSDRRTIYKDFATFLRTD